MSNPSVMSKQGIAIDRAQSALSWHIVQGAGYDAQSMYILLESL